MEGVLQNVNIPRAQTNKVSAGIIPVGLWGKQSGGDENKWSFVLDKGQKLKKITIDHGDDVIYSLKFTIEAAGGFTSMSYKKIGGWNGGKTVSEVTLGSDEEIVEIKGSVGTKAQYTIISSLSFVTNKTTHGPFGGVTTSEFSLPWENGLLVGFYGLAGHYIDGIGVYLRQILKIGTWGKPSGGPQNNWSFRLHPAYHLTKITINHGDRIYSLMFTAQGKEVTCTSEKFGDWNGGAKVSEITFDGDENINGISGTIALLRGTDASISFNINENINDTVLSSISFMTNKRTHGPFGDASGTPFTVPWDDGSFAGFYGLASSIIDSIGVYLKATNY